MPRKIIYNTDGIPYQEEFFETDDVFRLLLTTGFGGGKTHALVMKMFRLMNINRGCPGGILSPTFKMYKRDVVPSIVETCIRNGIRYHYNKGDMTWYFPDTGSVVYAFSAEDDGDSIRGPNLSWFAINEATLCSQKAVEMSIARVRLEKSKLMQVVMSGTPEGFNWMYEEYVEKQPPDFRHIMGDARLNRFVSNKYFKNLENSYDDKMQEQYIHGKFVNLSGNRCAWAFDRVIHTGRVERIPSLPVMISLDFNVDPLAGTLWNYVPVGMRDQYPGPPLRGFGEICIEGANTYDAASELRQLLDMDSATLSRAVTVYPDPAGRARSTKSHYSDFDILKQEGFTNLKYKTSISVRDCLNALNGMLGREQMILDQKNCRHTISDMEQCIFKGGAFEIDKSNPKRTHWLDGAKNMVEYEFPIKRPSAREERIR